MNLSKMKLTLVGICGLMLAPLASHAGTATQLDENTVLYTIDFAFYDERLDVEVPLMAEYGVTYTDRVDTVGYTLQSAEPAVAVADVTGVVLSQQSLVDDRYALSAGEEGLFTLVVLASYEEPVTVDQRAIITKIPYFWPDRRTTVHQNQLDELEPAVFEADAPGVVFRIVD